MTALDTWTFTVPGEPVPKARARHARTAHRVRTYTPASTVAYERAVGLAAVTACPRGLTGPIAVELLAVMPRLANATKREAGRTWHAVRPDADNLGKALLDGMVGAGVLRDDGCVAVLTVRKVRAALGESPHAEVTVSRLRDNP